MTDVIGGCLEVRQIHEVDDSITREVTLPGGVALIFSTNGPEVKIVCLGEDKSSGLDCPTCPFSRRNGGLVLNSQARRVRPPTNTISSDVVTNYEEGFFLN